MAVAGFLGTLLGLLVLGIYLATKMLVIENSGLQINDLLDSFEQLLQSRYSGEIILSIGMTIVITLVLSAITTPIGLLVISYILYSLARYWGGEGELKAQTYLLSTFSAPLYVITRTFWLVPYFGILLGVPLGVHQLFLTKRTIEAVHNLTGGVALRVILVPVFGVFLFMICGFVIMAIWWF